MRANTHSPDERATSTTPKGANIASKRVQLKISQRLPSGSDVDTCPRRGRTRACVRLSDAPLLIRGCICSPPSGTPDALSLSAGYARCTRSPAVKHNSPPSGTPDTGRLSAGYARRAGDLAGNLAATVGATLVVARFGDIS